MSSNENPQAKTFHTFTVKDASHQDFPLSKFQGQVTLAVNVASKCGFTPQYKGLEELYREYKAQGFTILGFPCNQFGGQEPGSSEEIQQFCSLNYDVTFPVLDKVEVNGDKAAPVYQWMKASAPGILGTEAIKWNFTKFLIGKDGRVLNRYSPQTDPKEISQDIQEALKA